jgi:hypothetical protein
MTLAPPASISTFAAQLVAGAPGHALTERIPPSLSAEQAARVGILTAAPPLPHQEPITAAQLSAASQPLTAQQLGAALSPGGASAHGAELPSSMFLQSLEASAGSGGVSGAGVAPAALAAVQHFAAVAQVPALAAQALVAQGMDPRAAQEAAAALVQQLQQRQAMHPPQ